MLHFAFLAAAKAAASCGRLSRASAPFPVSNSAYSSMMVSNSAAAKRSIAALCASIPSPERCCCCVETRRYATARCIQTAYHRTAFGRRAIQSNVLAHVAAAQTNAGMKTAAGIFALRPAGLKIDWFETFDPPAPVLRRLSQVAMGGESKM
jgi:hypothetical protein